MSQSRLSSFYEACMNIAIGFSINWVANLLILPIFGFNVTGGQAFGIGVFFTAISLVRSYVIRRWFNARLAAMAQRMSKEHA
jgi:uncharacterized membrane protein (DUF485 family)